MLKNCFYPVQYDNILNKTVGEIICQNEATFTIVCNLCELKIFQFNEFVKHFRLLHWSDTNHAAIICKTEQDNGNDAVKPMEEYLIKTETNVERDDEEAIYEEYALDEPVEDGHCHLQADGCQDKEDSHIGNSINEETDSCDSYRAMTILKKVFALKIYLIFTIFIVNNYFSSRSLQRKRKNFNLSVPYAHVLLLQNTILMPTYKDITIHNFSVTNVIVFLPKNCNLFNISTRITAILARSVVNVLH